MIRFKIMIMYSSSILPKSIQNDHKLSLWHKQKIVWQFQKTQSHSPRSGTTITSATTTTGACHPQWCLWRSQHRNCEPYKKTVSLRPLGSHERERREDRGVTTERAVTLGVQLLLSFSFPVNTCMGCKQASTQSNPHDDLTSHQRRKKMMRSTARTLP